MQTKTFVLTRDPIGDLFIEDETMDLPVEVTEETVRDLGATDADIEEARRGYRIEVETGSIEMLDTLLHGYE